MISGAKHHGLWSHKALFSSKVVFRKCYWGKSHLKSPFPIVPGCNYIRIDGAIFDIRSECWKRVNVFDMLDATQCLSLYRNENVAPLSLICSVDKLSASQSPLIMLCLVTVACLSVWKRDERNPRSITIKSNLICMILPHQKVTSISLVCLLVQLCNIYRNDLNRALLKAEGKDVFPRFLPISTSIALHICYQQRSRELHKDLVWLWHAVCVWPQDEFWS